MMHTKPELRRLHRSARRVLSEQDRAQRAAALAQTLLEFVPEDAVVAGYLPMAGEPDLLPFLNGHHLRGGEVYVPVVADSSARLLNWASWTPRAHLGPGLIPRLQEPAGGAQLSTAQLRTEFGNLVMLVPALAIDEAGARLGQGGGFYDTALDALRACRERVPQVLGIVYAGEIVAAGSFAVEAHDLRVDAVASEDGIIGTRNP